MRAKRAVIRLSGSLEKKLVAYTAAATAAGVGMLACSMPAEGKVVSTLSWTEIVPNGIVNLDLNNDGIPDFQFSNVTGRTTYRGFLHYGTLKVLPGNQSNAVWGTGGSASALGSGVTVGSNAKLQRNHQFMARGLYATTYHGNGYGSQGQWKEATRLYLGFKFTIGGEVHYGWARLNVTTTDYGIYAAVTKYAYETEPNTPIVTGQGSGTKTGTPQHHRSDLKSPRPSAVGPGSLGSLATGSVSSSSRQKPDK